MADNRRQLEELTAREDFWKPVERGGASFRTRRLCRPSPGRLEFRASVQTWLFAACFAALGAGIVVVSALLALGVIPTAAGESRYGGSAFVLLVGTGFAAVGAYLLHQARAPIVFDKRAGQHWRGRRDARPHEGRRRQESSGVPLADVVALQILEERVRRKNGSYRSYELNLVLADGRRVNVIDHGARERLSEDAEELGRFLRVPVLRAPATGEPRGWLARLIA